MVGPVSAAPHANPPVAGVAAGATPVLPPLREELSLYAGPAGRAGEPSWTLHDPIRNRFFRLGWSEFEMLSRWRPGLTFETLAREVSADTTLSINGGTVQSLLQFLHRNHLFQCRGSAALDHLKAAKDAARPALARRLLRSHLFIRLPLIRPDALLAVLQPFTAFAFSRGFLWAAGLAAGLGLYLVARQWDTFVDQFLYFLDWSGLALFALTVIGVKVLHELGHALTARRFGCRVPTMGVAFLVFWPVLYTDTTDAWKLPSKRQRLAISAAGVTVELMVAAFATLAWSFLPPGALQSAAFLVATTTWIVTLAVNLNPFMRFDGYFLLADLLNVHNLQERSFALAKWRLREALFGFGEPAPEIWSPAMRRVLLIYAYLTWIYRAALFVGIALAIYLLLFKLAGLAMLVLEIAWLVVFPIGREMSEWVGRRQALRFNRQTVTTALALAGLGIGLATPWTTHVTAPALLRTSSHAVVYAPAAARVDALPVGLGDTVARGETLVHLRSPDLDNRIDVARAELAVLEWRKAFEQMDAERRQQRLVVESKLRSAQAALNAFLPERSRLTVKAPIGGRVMEVADDLRSGDWVFDGEALLVIADTESAVIEAFIPEHEFGRVSPGAKVVFHAENVDIAPVMGVVEAVDPAGVQTLENPYVASLYGGDVPVREDRNGNLVLQTAHYRATITVHDANLRLTQMVRGEVVVEAERRSPLSRVWTAVQAVLIREIGF